ncbi:MAG: hypothetical protein CL678_08045 [Bdellovibrionaceae bacterium]|nr:hypothetical protein [Pseudobdellovibrionaceae bacterium]|tara:strand:+ start:6179 stop:7057 length:879 start_codon:yes stop_codon:yes gene_type:complete
MKLLFLTASLLLWTPNSFALRFYVETVKTVGGAESDKANVVEELIRSSVTDSGHHQVTESKRRAQYTLRAKLIQLGDTYSIALEKLDDDDTVYSHRLKAVKLDDLDESVTRLVKAVIRETPVKNQITGAPVEDNREVVGETRKDTITRNMIGFGPTLNSSNIDTDHAIALGLALAHSWDMNSASIDIKGDVTFGGKVGIRFLTLGLGGNYFFSQTNTSPFLGGELGLGFATKSRELEGSTVKGGFLIGLGGGYQFFRTRKINAEIALRVFALTGEINDSIPLSYALRVGVYF